MSTLRRTPQGSRLYVSGRIEIQVHDVMPRRDARGRFATGRPIARLARRVVSKNLVVSSGLTWICERMRSSALLPITNYQLGTNATPPAPGQTALSASSYNALFTKSNVVFLAGGAQLTIAQHLGRTQGNGPTYVEGGMFSGNGTMIARSTFPGVTKVNTQTMTIIHTITISAS